MPFWRRTPGTLPALAAPPPDDFLLVAPDGAEGDLWATASPDSSDEPALDQNGVAMGQVAAGDGSSNDGTDAMENFTADSEWAAFKTSLDQSAGDITAASAAPIAKPLSALSTVLAVSQPALEWEADGGNMLRLAAALSAEAFEAVMGAAARDITLTTADGVTFASWRSALAAASGVLRCDASQRGRLCTARADRAS